MRDLAAPDDGGVVLIAHAGDVRVRAPWPLLHRKRALERGQRGYAVAGALLRHTEQELGVAEPGVKLDRAPQGAGGGIRPALLDHQHGEIVLRLRQRRVQCDRPPCRPKGLGGPPQPVVDHRK